VVAVLADIVSRSESSLASPHLEEKFLTDICRSED
jgi:hypothetical protein